MKIDTTSAKSDAEKLINSFLDLSKKNHSNSKTIIGTSISFLLVLVVVSMLYFEAWRKGRELSSLQHEHDVEVQKEAMAAADAKVAEEKAKQDAALAAAREGQLKLEILSAKIEETQLQHAEITNKINSLSSWDDIDSFLNSGKNTSPTSQS